jgi:hypothetical protein
VEPDFHSLTATLVARFWFDQKSSIEGKNVVSIIGCVFLKSWAPSLLIPDIKQTVVALPRNDARRLGADNEFQELGRRFLGGELRLHHEMTEINP